MFEPIRITAETPAPPEGSVVLAYGLTGTAYQRLFSDGLFHSAAGGEPVDFAFFTDRADPQGRRAPDLLVYVAPEED